MSAWIDEYLQLIPKERRNALNEVRAAILKHLPKDYEEGPLYGGIGYFIPHSVYPQGYHCDPKTPLPLAELASKKNYMSLHLMTIYGNEDMRELVRRSLSQVWEIARHGQGLYSVSRK